MLVYNEKIRRELDLSNEEFELLRQRLQTLQASRPDFNEFSLSTSSERQVLLDGLWKEAEKIEPEIFQMLSRMMSPESLDKLMGWYLRFHGPMGLFNRRIGDRLRLTDDQRTKMETAIADLRIQKSVVLSEIASGKLATEKGIGLNKIDHLLLMRVSAFDAVVLPVLTEEQRKSYQEMTNGEVRFSNGLPIPMATFGW